MLPLQTFKWSLVLLCLISCVSGLFEDQAFKFDWSSQHIGFINEAQLIDKDNLITFSTSQSGNVSLISGISTSDGALRWRHVLESGSRVLDVSFLSESKVSILMIDASSRIILRSWNPSTGILNKETLLKTNSKTEEALQQPKFGFIYGDEVYLAREETKNSIKFNLYNEKTGNERSNFKMSLTSTVSGLECRKLDHYFTCLHGQDNVLFYTYLSTPVKSFNLLQLEAFGGSMTKYTKLQIVSGKADSLRLVSQDGTKNVVLVFKDGKIIKTDEFTNKEFAVGNPEK